MVRWLACTASLLVLLSPTLGSSSDCPGDCNGDHRVTIDELILGINIALGAVPVEACPNYDICADPSAVCIDVLIGHVYHALYGCRSRLDGEVCHRDDECVSGACFNAICCNRACMPHELCVDGFCRHFPFTPTPRTGTPTPTFTPTPTPQVVNLRVGYATGWPGPWPESEVRIPVTISSSGFSTVATSNDITYDNTVLDLDPESCSLDTAAEKSLLVNLLPAHGGGSKTTLRVFVQSPDNLSPIPDGPLYGCTFLIKPGTSPGAYRLANSAISAFGPSGWPHEFVTGTDGAILVR